MNFAACIYILSCVFINAVTSSGSGTKRSRGEINDADRYFLSAVLDHDKRQRLVESLLHDEKISLAKRNEAIFDAVRSNSLDIVQILIKQIQKDDAYNLILASIFYNNKEIFDALLEQHVELSPENRGKLLIESLNFNREEMFQILLHTGEIRGEEIINILFAAIEKDRFDMFVSLIQKVSISEENITQLLEFIIPRKKNNYLEFFISFKSDDLKTLLKAMEITINFHCPIDQQSRIEIINFLIKDSAKLRGQAVIFAITGFNDEIFDFLMGSGHIEDEECIEAIKQCVRRSSIRMINVLVQDSRKYRLDAIKFAIMKFNFNFDTVISLLSAEAEEHDVLYGFDCAFCFKNNQVLNYLSETHPQYGYKIYAKRIDNLMTLVHDSSIARSWALTLSVETNDKYIFDTVIEMAEITPELRKELIQEAVKRSNIEFINVLTRDSSEMRLEAVVYSVRLTRREIFHTLFTSLELNQEARSKILSAIVSSEFVVEFIARMELSIEERSLLIIKFMEICAMRKLGDMRNFEAVIGTGEINPEAMGGILYHAVSKGLKNIFDRFIQNIEIIPNEIISQTVLRGLHYMNRGSDRREMVLILIRTGKIIPNDADKALGSASNYNDEEIIDALLQFYQFESKTRITALRSAIKNRNLKIINELVKMSCDADVDIDKLVKSVEKETFADLQIKMQILQAIHNGRDEWISLK